MKIKETRWRKTKTELDVKKEERIRIDIRQEELGRKRLLDLF